MTIFNYNSGQLRFFMRLFVATLLFLSTGCALTNQADGQKYQATTGFFQTNKVGHWIYELEQARKLTSEEYRQILKAREIEYATNNSLVSRLRLSLLLLQGQNEQRDPSRALKILKGADSGLANNKTAFASFLLQLAEQQAMSDFKTPVACQKMHSKGKSKAAFARCKGASVSPKNHKSYLKEYRAAKARIKELEQQLLELTSIEQNIQERESGKLIEEQK
ncbi:MAG: hypothetical protein V3V12_00560 [Gammaproteobacteria bacterium]